MFRQILNNTVSFWLLPYLMPLNYPPSSIACQGSIAFLPDSPIVLFLSISILFLTSDHKSNWPSIVMIIKSWCIFFYQQWHALCKLYVEKLSHFDKSLTLQKIKDVTKEVYLGWVELNFVLRRNILCHKRYLASPHNSQITKANTRSRAVSLDLVIADDHCGPPGMNEHMGDQAHLPSLLLFWF